jgi:DNA-binding HxlR family transcriptional regulator
MGSRPHTDYCSFTKVVEHLGDKWCLLILRELAQFGPQGFNTLAAGLPGHVSRSVLSARLRTLADLGLVARTAPRPGLPAAYHLTDGGRALVPTLHSLREWAETHLPQDPAMIERDPDVVFGWLWQRVDPERVPETQAVVEVAVHHRGAVRRGWVVVAQGQEPYGCLEDPALDERRYVYLESSAAALLGVARGRQSLRAALADGSVEAYGDPDLVREASGWFLPADAEETRSPGSPVLPNAPIPA